MEALSGYSSESSGETHSPQSSAVTGSKRSPTSKGTAEYSHVRKFETKKDHSRPCHSSRRSLKELSKPRAEGERSRSRSPRSHHYRSHHDRKRSSHHHMQLPHSRSRSPTNHRRPAVRHSEDPRSVPESVSHSHKQPFGPEDSLCDSCSCDKPSSKVTTTTAATTTTTATSACSMTLEGTSLTPEEKLEQALAAAQALAPKLPTYLNPGAMNPRKYQTLQEKKKLLWNKKTHEEKSTNKWESVSFGGDDGDKAQAKFRRLMGIDALKGTTSDEESNKLRFQQEKTLSTLEQQYETSRYMTHMARGAGLGYGADSLLAEPKAGDEAS